MSSVKMLGLCGSLRRGSYNMAVLEAYQGLVPAGIKFEIFKEVGALPLFNPDLDEQQSASVVALKQAIYRADGLIIASPEYAHGISGVMKNALDWIVSDEDFPYMPVVLVNTSPRASHAQAALREVLTTMSARLIEKAFVTVPLLSTDFDANGIISHTEMSEVALRSIMVFAEEIISSK